MVVRCLQMLLGSVLLSSAMLAPALSDSLKVATDDWPPFRISTDHGFVGLDLDIVNELGRRIETGAEIIKMPWGRALTSMESGTVDIMTGLAYRDERAQYIAYTSTPYYTCQTAFYKLRTSAVRVDDYDDLSRYLIGFVLHSAYFPRFDKDQNLNKLGVAGEQVLIDMLEKGRLDIIVGTDCQVDNIIKANNLSDKIEKAAYRPGNTVDLYIGVSRKSAWANRLDEINQIMSSLVQEGYIDRFARKYYSN